MKYTLIALTIVVLGSGCDLLSRSSASMASLWSASASLESSSALWAQADDAYARDIAALTGAAVEAGASDTSLLRDLGRVASEHGVTDWENVRVSYVAIGVGLRSAGYDAEQATAFAERVFSGKEDAREALLEPYTT